MLHGGDGVYFNICEIQQLIVERGRNVGVVIKMGYCNKYWY